MFNLFNTNIKKQLDEGEREVHNNITGGYEKKIEKADYILPSAEGEEESSDDNESGSDDDDEENEGVEKGDILWPSLSSNDESEGFQKFEDSLELIPMEKGDAHICMGIVYEPDTEDSQGDMASAEEIEKAAFDFMENVQSFRVMHKGKPAKIKVLESYVAPVDFTINKRNVKKGSWILTTRINDPKIWKDIKAGKLTGYSMAGVARVA